jgi:hypothetical protein
LSDGRLLSRVLGDVLDCRLDEGQEKEKKIERAPTDKEVVREQ